MSTLPITPRLPTGLLDGVGTKIRRDGAGYRVDVDLPDTFGTPHTVVNDANYQVLLSDRQVGLVSLSAPRTVTLPDVDAYIPGQTLFIADESGQCSTARPITIVVGAGTSDSIAGQPAIQITDAYQGIGLRRGATNVWIIAR